MYKVKNENWKLFYISRNKEEKIKPIDFDFKNYTNTAEIYNVLYFKYWKNKIIKTTSKKYPYVFFISNEEIKIKNLKLTLNNKEIYVYKILNSPVILLYVTIENKIYFNFLFLDTFEVFLKGKKCKLKNFTENEIIETWFNTDSQNIESEFYSLYIGYNTIINNVKIKDDLYIFNSEEKKFKNIWKKNIISSFLNIFFILETDYIKILNFNSKKAYKFFTNNISNFSRLDNFYIKEYNENWLIFTPSVGKLLFVKNFNDYKNLIFKKTNDLIIKYWNLYNDYIILNINDYLFSYDKYDNTIK